MKKLERITAITTLIAIGLFFTRITGGTVLTIISLTVLAILYFPLGFMIFNNINLKGILKKDSYKGTSALRILGSVAVGAGLSTICIGILFKLLNWPGADLYLISGLIFTFSMVSIALFRYIKTKNELYKNNFIRIVVIIVIGMIFYVTPYVTIVKLQYHNYPNYIKTYEEYLKNPNDINLKRKLELEHMKTYMTEEEINYHMEILKNNSIND